VHRDFRAIDWNDEFAAEPLIITGAGILNKGDIVTVSFVVKEVQYYSDSDCYQAKLIARCQKPPKISVYFLQSL
jgi:hypothetical protein